MKRLVVVLGGLLALPAFAEVAPYYYTDALEYADAEYAMDGDVIDEEVAAEEDTDIQKPVVPVKASPRITTTRNGSRANVGTTTVNPRRTSAANSRVVAARTTTSRTPLTTSRAVVSRATTTRTPVATSRTAVTRGSVSRAATNSANAGGSTRRAANTPSANVARAGISTTTATVQTATGKTETVFEDNNLYTGRIGIRSSASASSRVPTIRVASATMTTSTSSSAATPNVAETTSEMDKLAELTDYCKAQYTACMDNFCNVLDDNQGRCSCSANLKNYEKTEQALKAATEELQEIAQKIQYIGLTGDEITTLFSETEAEETMRNQTDNSQIKANLDKVRDMIIDVRSGSSTTSDTGMTFDLSNLLDFTISSTGFDLSALLGTSTNTTSINNQRGETLYKTAAARCKANVLNSCTAQGVDASVITNSYDLEIDKQCIAYERDLSDSNDQMTATVRNAKAVLQKARLMVAQQRNQYDLRGCVAALDACMQDDYVCGADYENCLDPSGKYIVNGQIIVGSLPGRALSGDNGAARNPGMFKTSLYETWCTDSSCSKFAWDYDGQTSGDLADYINDTLYTGNVYPKQTSTNMSKFLQYKIGYHDSSKNTTEGGRNFGMCMSVLNKCQDYTYDKKRNYKPDNNVISEYLYRTMIQIRAAQDAILSEYAESCIQDVASCLSTNGYDVATNKNIPVNACKAIIATCMSVNGNVTKEPSPSEMLDWAAQVYDGTIAASSDANTGSSGGGSSSSTTTTTYYSITYQCGSGTTGMAPSAVTNITAGTNRTLATSAGSCSKSGYTFDGWDCGSGSITVNSNVVCTAQWTGSTPACELEPYKSYKEDEPKCYKNITVDYSDCTPIVPNSWDCSCDVDEYLDQTDYVCRPCGQKNKFVNIENGKRICTYQTHSDGGMVPSCPPAGDMIIADSCHVECNDGYKPNAAGDGCVVKEETPQTYTITYNCAGGNGVADGKTQTCTADEEVTLEYEPTDCGTNSGTSGGVSFTYSITSNWVRADNGSQVSGTTYNCDSDVTLRASWSAPAMNGARLDATCTEVDDNYTHNGCVAKNFRCKPTNFVLDGTCKEPCYGIQSGDDEFTAVYANYGDSTSTCPDGPSPDGTPGGCVAKYCKCGDYSYNTVDDNDKPICKKITTFTLRYDCGSYAATGTPPASQTYEEGDLVELAQDWGTCEFSGQRFAGWNCPSLPENNIIVSNVDCSAKWTE